jgi:hypothetical protein
MRVSLRFGPTLLLVLLICATAAVAKIARPPATGPDPATKAWPEWPHQVACEEGRPFDPVAAFSTPTGVESGELPSERALRRVLASGELPLVRQHGWRHLTETPRAAEFAAGRLFTRPGPTHISGLEWIELEKVGGSWRLGSFREACMPRSIRRGTRATPWGLDEEQDLNPNTRRIRVNLEPQVCNQVRHFPLQKPEFREQNGDLLMTLWRRPGHGRASNVGRLICPPQSKKATIELPEKLGRRALLDGATYPPLPVSIVVARR